MINSVREKWIVYQQVYKCQGEVNSLPTSLQTDLTDNINMIGVNDMSSYFFALF